MADPAGARVARGEGRRVIENRNFTVALSESAPNVIGLQERSRKPKSSFFFWYFDAPPERFIGNVTSGIESAKSVMTTPGANFCSGDATEAHSTQCQFGDTCWNWPGGYCTRSCNGACGEGSTCVTFTGGAQFCMETCDAPGAGRGTCRPDYECKRLSRGVTGPHRSELGDWRPLRYTRAHEVVRRHRRWSRPRGL